MVFIAALLGTVVPKHIHRGEYDRHSEGILSVVETMNNRVEKELEEVDESLLEDARELGFVAVRICPPNPDGVCGGGYKFWELDGDLYASLPGGASTPYYGPLGKVTPSLERDLEILQAHIDAMNF